MLTGIVEVGLFCHMAKAAYFGNQDGSVTMKWHDGRTEKVDGANMGQLAAFKISRRRWYMFQNMGPEPAPRSGHGMAAVGSKVYVLGGVSEDQLSANGKDASVMYILETSTCCVVAFECV